MGRHSRLGPRNYKLARDKCEVISIIDCAKEKLIQPGRKTAGHVELVCGLGGMPLSWVPIRGFCNETEGVLRVFYPYEDEIFIKSKEVKTRHRRLWYFVCSGLNDKSCNRLSRLMFRPLPTAKKEIEPFWACSECWRIGYLTGRSSWKQRTLEHRARLLRVRGEIDMMLKMSAL